MDYTKYSVEDLASDEGFIEWAKGGDPPSRAFWDNFVMQHPDMQVKVQQARTLVLNLAKAEKRQFPEYQFEDIWNAIDTRINEPNVRETFFPKRRSLIRLAIAAGLSAIVAAVLWTFAFDHHSWEPSSPMQASVSSEYLEEINTSGAVKRIHLSDGSTVALENNGRLRYRRDFTTQDARVVYLTGEAFFEVAKDPTKPFLVHADQIVTRVLGTSFRVKAQQDDGSIIISVKTGKVSVYALSDREDEEESQKNAVILMPNQQLTYQRELETFGKDIVEEPEILSPAMTYDDFNFEDRPISEVFAVLENAYGIEIIFDEEVMSRCHFTAPLGSEPLFDKLQIICRAIGARYEVIDAKVVITSAGC